MANDTPSRCYALTALALVAVSAGCVSLPEDCSSRLRCTASTASVQPGRDAGMPDASRPSEPSDAGADADADAGADADVEPETPPECIPSPEGSEVPERCGVFVRESGNDADPGSKDSPVATLARAIELALQGSKRVYACAEEFKEALVVGSESSGRLGLSIYGGLSCKSGWVFTGAAATIITPERGVPLTMRGADSSFHLADIELKAPDAISAGESSIAAIADRVRAELVRCTLVAGRGLDGAPGESAPPSPAAPGLPGSSGDPACAAEVVSGGAGASNTCGAVVSSGGSGGQGKSSVGSEGSAGLPALGAGAPGSGDTGAASFSCALGGGDGHDGALGATGADGYGGNGLGVISAFGYHGVNGGDGEAGAPGQGGGGGGGRAALTACSASKGGASGGGGGAGGCGGRGGSGGSAAGSSIALISLEATLTLNTVILRSGRGGLGGAGGDFQPGGSGGSGGAGGTGGARAGCQGGRGGAGGAGGVGGGGRGGHSIGLAYTGVRPLIEDNAIKIGVAGTGGASHGIAGADGLAVNQQKFD